MFIVYELTNDLCARCVFRSHLLKNLDAFTDRPFEIWKCLCMMYLLQHGYRDLNVLTTPNPPPPPPVTSHFANILMYRKQVWLSGNGVQVENIDDLHVYDAE